MYTTFYSYIHLSLDGYLGWFYSLVIVNSTWVLALDFFPKSLWLVWHLPCQPWLTLHQGLLLVAVCQFGLRYPGWIKAAQDARFLKCYPSL